ncbi:MAG: SDR family NAD(P)-dependent oxidoreductase, partial [Oceanobacter sp.]
MKQSSIKSSSIKSPNMKPSLNFSGKTALIMGASRGIGLATARLFVELGANVFMTGRSMPSLSEAADAINAQTRAVDPDQSPGKATALACDVSDYASVQSAVDQCLQQAQRIDFLVNNAGVIDPLTHLI